MVKLFLRKCVKILQKNLEVKKKVVPLHSHLRKGGLNRDESSTTSSLKRLIYCTRSKYRENTIYREALISLEIRSVSIKLEIYKTLYNEEFDPGSG